MMMFAAITFAATPIEYVEEDIVLRDVMGNRHIIDQYLEDGISVILNFSSTWCRPCWKYEQRGILDVVWQAFGPDGSKQAVVLFLEADPRTSEDCLFGQDNCNDFSYGDWTKKPYPTISLSSRNLFLNKTYKITRFPSVIGISAKDRSIHTLGQITLREWKEWILSQSKPIVQSFIKPAEYVETKKITVEAKLERIRRAVIPKKDQITFAESKIDEVSLSIFPNPCAESIHVEIPNDSKGAMITFEDNFGNEITDRIPKYIPPGTSRITIRHLKKGIYSIRVQSRKYRASNKFIVVN
jgi:hypothetical protein